MTIPDDILARQAMLDEMLSRNDSRIIAKVNGTESQAPEDHGAVAKR